MPTTVDVQQTTSALYAKTASAGEYIKSTVTSIDAAYVQQASTAAAVSAKQTLQSTGSVVADYSAKTWSATKTTLDAKGVTDVMTRTGDQIKNGYTVASAVTMS